MRYELKLDFKRMETVKAEKGYRGPVVVCAIYFVPIAGYIPDRPVIKYLAAQRNIEIAFAPVAGTRILVPFWMKMPTPLGPAMLEATSFITTADAAAGREDAVRAQSSCRAMQASVALRTVPSSIDDARVVLAHRGLDCGRRPRNPFDSPRF